MFIVCADTRGVGEESRETNTALTVDWPRTDGHTVRLHGTTNVVGVLMGCHGTCDLLCRLRNGYCYVCLLCYNTTSECLVLPYRHCLSYGIVFSGDNWIMCWDKKLTKGVLLEHATEIFLLTGECYSRISDLDSALWNTCYLQCVHK